MAEIADGIKNVGLKVFFGKVLMTSYECLVVEWVLAIKLIIEDFERGGSFWPPPQSSHSQIRSV